MAHAVRCGLVLYAQGLAGLKLDKSLVSRSSEGNYVERESVEVLIISVRWDIGCRMVE